VRNPWRDDRTWDARDVRDESPLPGVIDTFGNGFAALVNRPFAILPLLFLDLFLLLMPRATLGAVGNWVADRVDRTGRGWDELLAELEALERFNAFDLAIIRVPLARLPALLPTMSNDERAGTGWQITWDNVSFPWALAIVGATLIGGFLLSSIYRSMAANVVLTDDRALDLLRPGRIARMALQLLLWVLTVIGLITLVALPVIVLTIAGALLGLESLAIAWIFILVPIAWGFVHFYFSLHALFLDQRGALLALKTSYRVVRRYFWQTIQFIAVTFVLTTGLTYLLTAMAADRYGVFLAIVLNAFVATGLIVAAMLFYRDRVSRLDLPSGSSVSGR
jgi:hypothetical protein